MDIRLTHGVHKTACLEGGSMTNETIGERLDRLYPAKCYACGTPYKRTDAKWHDHASRIFCKACGLDQTSAEAGSIARYRTPEYSQASELDADQYDAEFRESKQNVCQWCHGNPCTCPHGWPEAPEPVEISETDLRGVFNHKCDQPTCPVCTGMSATEWAELYERAARYPGKE